MNLMGKIFTLLIFFMSICFLVISVMVGATHRNWKEIAAAKQNEARQATTRLQAAKSTTTEKEKLLQGERVSRAIQLANLESQLKIALDNVREQGERYDKEQTISQARLTELEAATARLKQQDGELAALKADVTRLTDSIRDQFRNVRILTNDNFELRNQSKLLAERKSKLEEENAKQIKVLRAHGLTESSLIDHIPPKVDGKVVRILKDTIAVSLGSDDGVNPGHVMDIYRDDRYIGKAIVVTAKNDISALRIEKDFMLGEVREGDSVTTKF